MCMKDDNIQFNLQEPELPESLKDARRNHVGMTVPEDFFAQFEKKMNAVIDAEELTRKAAESPAIRRPETAVLRPKRWIAVAASVVVIVAVGITWQFNNQSVKISEETIDGFAALAGEQIENIELPDQVADEVMASVSDYDVFDLYCDI